MAGYAKPRRNAPAANSAARAAALCGDPNWRPKTADELRRQLLAIRDAGIDWAQDLTMRRETAGMSCAWLSVEKAEAELQRVDDREAGRTPGGGVLNLLVNGLDVTKLNFGANAKK